MMSTQLTTPRVPFSRYHPRGPCRARGATSVEYIILISALFLMMVFSFSLFGATINTRVGGMIEMVQGKDLTSSAGGTEPSVIVASVEGRPGEAELDIEVRTDGPSFEEVRRHLGELQTLLGSGGDANEFIYKKLLNGRVFKDAAVRFAVASGIVRLAEIGSLLAEGDIAAVFAEIAAMPVEFAVKAVAMKVLGGVVTALVAKGIIVSFPVVAATTVAVAFASNFIAKETSDRFKAWAKDEIRGFIDRNPDLLDGAANGINTAARTYFLFTP